MQKIIVIICCLIVVIISVCYVRREMVDKENYYTNINTPKYMAKMSLVDIAFGVSCFIVGKSVNKYKYLMESLKVIGIINVIGGLTMFIFAVIKILK